MITAEEIRLGILVNTPREDQNPFRVDLVDFLYKEGCKVGMNVHTYEHPVLGTIDGHPLTWELKDISGIPITEDWLIRFEFEKHEAPSIIGNSFMIEIGRFRRICVSNPENGNEMIFIINYDVKNETTDIVCIHNFDYQGRLMVHQLQNLYFSLTGEELIIQP